MKPYARHKARKLALQAIYQWQMTHDDIFIIEAQFASSINVKKILLMQQIPRKIGNCSISALKIALAHSLFFTNIKIS